MTGSADKGIIITTGSFTAETLGTQNNGLTGRCSHRGASHAENQITVGRILEASGSKRGQP